MTTQAQIDANRENAKHSTGPATAEGKEISRRNAVRHGILASVIAAETPGYQDTLHGLYESLRPQDEPQRLLVDQIAVAIVRLQRVLVAEQRFLDSAANSGEESKADAAISKYLLSDAAALTLRYESALNRLIQRNLHLFRQMKAEWDWKQVRKGACPYVDSPPGEPAAGENSGAVEHIADAIINALQIGGRR